MREIAQLADQRRYAVLDALRACKLPIIEVHLSNTAQREDYRHHSWVTEAATGLTTAASQVKAGARGYQLGPECLAVGDLIARSAQNAAAR